MKASRKPAKRNLVRSLKTCLENGNRLLEETYDLEFRKPESSRFYLLMVAQEEFAKGFLIWLISEGIVPFTAPVLRAMNDHSCKQLVGMIMDYVIMHWDEIEDLKAAIASDFDLGDSFPNDIGSAIEILRYEKIGRWEANNWAWAEDPGYDRAALKVAEGKKDRRKQDALYVRIGRDGRVSSSPTVISEQETREEFERARRYGSFVHSLVMGSNRSFRLEKTIAAFRSLFASSPETTGVD